ncbi:MAG TPA: carboxymuconolactone decarboxylase family protein [Gemmatimonadaceae bacterium]|nr:carboxymuconolactone decarboxylase family protein [Gemmatimonadaceae bacterium]
MTDDHPTATSVHALDAATAALVVLAAEIAAGDEGDVRRAVQRALQAAAPHLWIEELVLQSYLFAGFPRTLNAGRVWRKMSGRPAPPAVPPAAGDRERWRTLGERTCAIVYGASYERLRVNIRALHPELDDWMIVEGYGKVLSRPGLDLVRRELCIVAVCAVTGQERQLHSHLRGARNAGASADQVRDVLSLVAPRVGAERAERNVRLLERTQSGA